MRLAAWTIQAGGGEPRGHPEQEQGAVQLKQRAEQQAAERAQPQQQPGAGQHAAEGGTSQKPGRAGEVQGGSEAAEGLAQGEAALEGGDD
jgi:hypothetical protein